MRNDNPSRGVDPRGPRPALNQPAHCVWTAGAGLIVLLVGLTVAVFWPVHAFDFVRYDDPLYVVDNPHVRSGLDFKDMLWAFYTGESASWQPITWLSLMLDAEAFGPNPRAFHLTNLAIHVLNVVLVFLLLQRMTGDAWKSAFVAALFAIHPLRVEPVAWISERKGLLSMLFGLLALAAYLRYAQARGRRWLVLSLAAYLASLMSKQMLVTFPFLLLLLDYWPLKRVRTPVNATTESTADATRTPAELLREKIPFFVLALLFSVSAYAVQNWAGAISTFAEMPMTVRVTNATVAYAVYLAKTLWPTHLAVYYPHWGHAPPAAHVAASALVLFVLTALAIHQRTRHPYLIVGWLWYLGSLVPVIGLVHIGGAKWAIRYTYVPLLGVFIAVTWLVDSLMSSRGWQRQLKWAAALATIAACALVSSRELEHWRDTLALFTHALKVADENTVAYNNAGNALARLGRYDEAIELYERALELKPTDFDTHINYGVALYDLKQWDSAIGHYREALKAEPDSSVARNHLGNVFFARGQYDEAAESFRAALAIDATFEPARHGLELVERARAK
ncbi:MAG: tetratricopeptide repeat protein [Planctomycetaceae bacterium]